jgi:hypothetical protein
MSSFISPHAVMHSDGEDRQAPSSVVNACTSQARWHLVLGLFCCGWAGILFWATYEMVEGARIIRDAGGPPPLLPAGWMLAWGGECSLLALGAGLLLLRSFSAMRRLKESRRISDLHRTLYRVRTVWRMFALAPLLAAAPLIVLFVWDRFSSGN